MVLHRFPLMFAMIVISSFTSNVTLAEWKAAPNPLMTKWAADVDPKKPLPEYPRPQLVREHWKNLNGLWNYTISGKDQADRPEKWDGEILVPFPVESSLSGVQKVVGSDRVLWYRRTFSVSQDAGWKDKQILLHFEAVDWQTTVWVNGEKLGEHRGGYDPFTYDITAALKDKTEHELVVRVFDPSDAGYQPRGKQVQKPEGIYYTPTTGIWQTVWLEPVPKSYLRGVTITPNIDTDSGKIQFDIVGDQVKQIAVKTRWKDSTIEKAATFTLPADSKPMDMDRSPDYRKQLWTPESPNLTDVELQLLDSQGKVIDTVSTYFARRKISVGKDDKGVTRIMLNNQPYFQIGPLDQGFWPDGLYTAPTDEALKSDIEITKQYGFNLIRKHVKVEPARWYYWCDKLGVVVWQDMPSGDKSPQWDPFGKFDGQEIKRSHESADDYRAEWKSIIDSRRHFPCIVMWVPFNEAWGQFDTVKVTQWTKEYDPSRLVNCASGGNDFPVGDIVDVHRYPGPFAPKPENHRAAVLGEFGGLGLPLEGHTWVGKGNWGYVSFTDQKSLTEAYLDLIDQLHPMISQDGLSAAIYTQTTDVEVEVNGLMTYDRKVQKLSPEVLAKAHRTLWGPPSKLTTILETSQKESQRWRYTTDKPDDKWMTADFDDANWKEGVGGFGTAATPGSAVKTEWKSPDIWLRKTFELSSLPTGEIKLRMHHDDEAEVYINGALVKKVGGWTTGYTTFRLPESAKSELKVGKNTLAVHCHQAGGDQYIDAGLLERK